MSSGQHLSKDIYDLIKSIGETRSKQEEDRIITQELALLKQKINDKNVPPKKQKENLIRAIYIEMLGHDASFSYIHAVNLTQSKSFALKRMGYLACNLFLNENSEFLILVVATLQRDLMSKNVLEICVALNSLCKIICPSIVHALVDPVIKLLRHENEIVRKKAVMAMKRIYNISSQLVADYPEKLKNALCDKDPSVMGATLNLYYEVVKENPNKFKDVTSSFVVILKQIIEHKLAKEYDYHRMPAPWLIIKTLRILALLGANDLKTSEHIYEILSMALKKADDTTNNIGFAITYQCVKTVSQIYPNQALLEKAASSISRFLTSDNNNLKFLGINALIAIVQINPKYALEHQMVVVDCLESQDETLKRETLELLHRMTNANNVVVIVEKLVYYLKSAIDSHYRSNLVSKIMNLSERFAPNQEWFISSMNMLFEHGAETVTQEHLTNVIKLIEESYRTNQAEIGQFLIFTYYEIIQRDNLPDVMIKLIAWVFGEIGREVFSQDSQKLEDLINLLAFRLKSHYEDDLTKGWILNAISKIASAPGYVPGSGETENMWQYFARSSNWDIFQRSIEYRKLNKLWAQRSSSSFDKSLSFLSKYVQKALDTGAKPYDTNRGKAGLSTLGYSSGVDVLKTELNFKPYNPRDINTAVSAATKSEDSSGLKIVGPKVWGAEGYDDSQQQQHKMILQQQQQQKLETKTPVKQQGLSSEDIIKRGGNIPVDPGKTMALSSEHFKGTSSSTTQPRFESNPVLPPKKKEDPLQKEKEMLANSIFGLAPAQQTPAGTGSLFSTANKPANPWGATSNIQKTTFAPATQAVNINASAPKTQKPVAGAPQGKPTTSGTIDLLDLDFSEPVNPITQIQQASTTSINPPAGSSQKMDLLGALGGLNMNTSNNQINTASNQINTKPVTQNPTLATSVNLTSGVNQGSSAGSKNNNLLGSLGASNGTNKPMGINNSASSKGNNDLLNFGAGTTVKQINYQPYKVSLEEYEQYWELYPTETIQVLQNTLIRNEAQFSNLIKRANLAIVEVIGNEVICSGKNASNEVVLVYAIYEPSGKLELRIKCKSSGEKEDIFQKLKGFSY